MYLLVACHHILEMELIMMINKKLSVIFRCQKWEKMRTITTVIPEKPVEHQLYIGRMQVKHQLYIGCTPDCKLSDEHPI